MSNYFPSERKKHRGGYVYLVQSGRYYKIGMTGLASLNQRVYAIEREVDRGVTLVAQVEVAIPRFYEGYLHFTFRQYHWHKEWFLFPSEKIKSIIKDYYSSEAVEQLGLLIGNSYCDAISDIVDWPQPTRKQRKEEKKFNVLDYIKRYKPD